MVNLKHLSSEKNLVFCNSHYEWNPKYDHIKQSSAFWMMWKIQEFYAEQQLDMQESPFIITGDLNSFPESSALNLLENKFYM